MADKGKEFGFVADRLIIQGLGLQATAEGFPAVLCSTLLVALVVSYCLFELGLFSRLRKRRRQTLPDDAFGLWSDANGGNVDGRDYEECLRREWQ